MTGDKKFIVLSSVKNKTEEKKTERNFSLEIKHVFKKMIIIFSMIFLDIQSRFTNKTFLRQTFEVLKHIRKQ